MIDHHRRLQVTEWPLVTDALNRQGVCGLVSKTLRHSWVCLKPIHLGSTYHQHYFVRLAP